MNIFHKKLNLKSFKDHRFHPHALHLLMTEPKEKSPISKYLEATEEKQNKIVALVGKISLAKSAMDAIENKSLKKYETAKQKYDKAVQEREDFIEMIDLKIKGLEKNKDKIHLSETTKKYLVKEYLKVKTGREFGITNKYVEKGLAMEHDSIGFYSDATGEYYVKNEVRKQNDYFDGECDIDDDYERRTHDIKNRYDLETFQNKTIEPMSALEYWQGYGYMDLYDSDSHTVANILLNVPKIIIDKEKNKILWELGGKDFIDTIMFEEACKALEKNLIFDDIPKEERIYCVTIERDEDEMIRLKERIELCRQWLDLYAISEYNRVYNKSEYVPMFDMEEKIKPEKEVAPVFVLKKIEEQSVVTVIHEKVVEGQIIEEVEKLTDKIEDTPITIVVKEDNDDSYNDDDDDEPTFNPLNLSIAKDPYVSEDNASDEDEYDNYTPTETTEPAPLAITPAEHEKTETNLEIEGFKMKIAICSSHSDCFNLFKASKPFLELHPELKILLEQKRESFKDVPSVPKLKTDKPAKEDKPVKQDNPAEDKSAPEAAPVAATDKQEFISKIEVLVANCKDSTAVRAVYQEYKQEINKIPKLRNHLTQQTNHWVEKEEQQSL